MQYLISNGSVEIDEESIPLISGFKWYVSDNKRGHRYARTKRKIYMHRIIAGLSEGDGLVVDHINGNGLDNRKANIRVVTVAENNANRRSRKGLPTGVLKYRKGFMARIRRMGKIYYLGTFKTQQDATKAVYECLKRIDPVTAHIAA